MTPPNPHPDHPAMSEQVRGEGAPAGLSVADVLDRAADRLEAPGKWRQGILYAQDAKGHTVIPTSPDAACFCLIGAVACEWQAGVGEVESRLRNMPTVNSILAGGEDAPAEWNDLPGRSQAEVVAALRSAAAAARAQVGE